jgi:hypothetical protein
MNPKAVSFDPVASPSSEAESTIMPSYKSLVRCLEGEQERHLETKAKLAAVLSRVKELEAEVVDLYAEKQALSGSVEFMSNIIQQNMNHITKDNATNFAKASDEAEDSSKTPVPTGLKINGNNSNNGDKVLDGEAYKNVVNGHVGETGKTQLQLQTPVKLRFGEDPFITDGHALSEEIKTPVKGSAISETDEAPKFNLDLLKTGQTPGTPASARSIVLRKHFNAEDGPNNSPTDTINGINGSDETDDNANVAEVTPTKGKTQDKNKGSSDIGQAASVAGESAATTKSQAVKLQVRLLSQSRRQRANRTQTAEDPILELVPYPCTPSAYTDSLSSLLLSWPSTRRLSRRDPAMTSFTSSPSPAKSPQKSPTMVSPPFSLPQAFVASTTLPSSSIPPRPTSCL